MTTSRNTIRTSSCRAWGISIGLTRLFYVLGEQGYLNDSMNRAPADVLILPMTDDMAPAIALATSLRGAGVRTQLYSEQKKFKHKIGYADKLGIPYVIFLGEDEIRENVLAVKDMESGEQVKVSLDEAIARIRTALRPRIRARSSATSNRTGRRQEAQEWSSFAGR